VKSNFENLRVYQLAEKVADHIWDIAAGWDDFAKRTVGGQIVRSADSIGANIAEGTGRGELRGQPAFRSHRSRLAQ
jgi:four helix bundle protein